jgi:DNA modification methylase
VSAEKAARGKLPTDVWWHTIVPTNGKEKTGYPNQKPEGVLRRVLEPSSRPGDWVLDFFAGSGTAASVAAAMGRRFVMVDLNRDAISVIRRRLGAASVAFLDQHGEPLAAFQDPTVLAWAPRGSNPEPAD